MISIKIIQCVTQPSQLSHFSLARPIIRQTQFSKHGRGMDNQLRARGSPPKKMRDQWESRDPRDNCTCFFLYIVCPLINGSEAVEYHSE
ncbi:unnamed protein product [Caenorhabditis nigoni]